VFGDSAAGGHRDCTDGDGPHEIHHSGEHSWTDRSARAFRRCSHEMAGVGCCDEKRLPPILNAGEILDATRTPAVNEHGFVADDFPPPKESNAAPIKVNLAAPLAGTAKAAPPADRPMEPAPVIPTGRVLREDGTITNAKKNKKK
jgi:hypothetical protein